MPSLPILYRDSFLSAVTYFVGLVVESHHDIYKTENENESSKR